MKKISKVLATGLAVLTVAGSMSALGLSASAVSPEQLAVSVGGLSTESGVKYHTDAKTRAIVIDNYGSAFPKKDIKQATVNGVQYSYAVYNGKAYITDVATKTDAAKKSVSVATKLDNIPVFRIATLAFMNTNSKEIRISGSVALEPGCFTGNKVVEKVVFGDDVSFTATFLTKTGTKAFAEDYYYIPAMTCCGSYGVCYSKSMLTASSALPTANLRKVTAMSGMGMFGNCDNLKSVRWSKKVTTIPANAFWCCDALTSVSNLDTVTTVGEAAFQGTTIKKISLPSVTKVRMGAFGMSGLSDLVLGSQNSVSFEFESLMSIDQNAYSSSIIHAANVGKVVFERNAFGTDFVGAFGFSPERRTCVYANPEKMNVVINDKVSSAAQPYYDFNAKYIQDYTGLNKGKLVIYTNDANAKTYQAYRSQTKDAPDFVAPYIVAPYLNNKSSSSKSYYYVGNTFSYTKSASGGAYSVAKSKNKSGFSYNYILEYRESGANEWKAFDGKFTKAGTYDVRIGVIDVITTCYQGGKPLYQAPNDIRYVTKTGIKVYNKLTNSSAPSSTSIKSGESVTINGKSSGGSGNTKYMFQYQQPGSTKWRTMGTAYDGHTSYKFKPNNKGTYTVKVSAKDSKGTVVSKTMKFTVK